MSTWLQRFWLKRNRRFALRLWLALSSGGLLLVFGLGLVLFINVAATIALSTMPVVVLPEPLSSDTDWQPGQPTPTPLPAADGYEEPANLSPATLIRQAALGQLRVISLIGLALMAVLGSAGAYWLAERTLRPVREVSQTAKRIGASTLNTRLVLAGPEDELKELADAFNAMLDRLEGAFAQQSRFVADAAHELRTPLATLRTNLEVISTNPDVTLEDYREMVITLERALMRLERLVAGLLVLAQGEKEVIKEELVLGPLLEEVLLALTPLADERRVTLRLKGKPEVPVYGDGPLLARAFANLVENGIRYNRPDGEVVVTISDDDDWAVVTIADTGIGIPAEEQVHIFDRFYRVDRSRTWHHGGAGLGLSIAAHVVQQHGGQIQVESTPGLGSTFTVRLPL